ncbi:MAG: alpha/beta hydrolase [Verrucomicrobia bacterium]|nr:alpha/beta hydrolase [Verrucomicrobiota bacterium]
MRRSAGRMATATQPRVLNWLGGLVAVCLLGGGACTLRAAETPETPTQVIPDVAYLADDRVEKLDLYLPAPPAAGVKSPALVWIHGGGWMGGTKNEARAKNICTTLANAGYVAVSIDYRLGAGAWPTNLHDCKNAVRFLRANAGKYRLDPERIAVAGGSAGGHLALMVALTGGLAELEPVGAATPYPGVSSAVRCGVNFYGITDVPAWRVKPKAGEPAPANLLRDSTAKVYGVASLEAPVLRLASPITHVKASSVPLLTLHGRSDETVELAQAETLDRVAKERGARHELIVLDGIGHTFDLERWGKKPLPRDLRPVFLEFLVKHLGKEGVRE